MNFSYTQMCEDGLLTIDVIVTDIYVDHVTKQRMATFSVTEARYGGDVIGWHYFPRPEGGKVWTYIDGQDIAVSVLPKEERDSLNTLLESKVDVDNILSVFDAAIA